jgi:hypothetical protein
MIQYDWPATVESDKHGPGSLWDKEFVTRWPVKNNKDFGSVFEQARLAQSKRMAQISRMLSHCQPVSIF